MSVQKRKGDTVNKRMRDRLLQNRNGQISTDQWLDLVTEPLVALLLLVAPAMIILGPRFSWFAVSLPLPLIFVLGLLALAVPALLRARRYARAPIHFDVLYAENHPRPPLKFWQPQEFETEDGTPVRFYKRLAPFMFFRPNHPYLVYYLEDRAGLVLLSVAPADHPEADEFYPTKFFQRRKSRRRAE